MTWLLFRLVLGSALGFPGADRPRLPAGACPCARCAGLGGPPDPHLMDRLLAYERESAEWESLIAWLRAESRTG
ncbi:hypothetical protein [Streptomyces sp. NPDC093109]|uniref:hypothetical protein n=1 Tax=Streptomyces sp. NPDC093109 TaxID=3154977 RepID=UPI00344EC9D8